MVEIVYKFDEKSHRECLKSRDGSRKFEREALLPVQSHPLLGHTQFEATPTVRLHIGFHFKFQVILYNSALRLYNNFY